jgi:hypothetical protein
MADIFTSYHAGLDSPANRHYTITPGAGELAQTTRAIYCDVEGTASITDMGGTSVTYNLVAGQILPIRAVKVTAATATLIAWY